MVSLIRDKRPRDGEQLIEAFLSEAAEMEEFFPCGDDLSKLIHPFLSAPEALDDDALSCAAGGLGTQEKKPAPEDSFFEKSRL